MMLYEVPSSFIKIDETTGILQNASSGNSLEVSNENEVNSGIILKPGESLSFQNTDLYVRTVGNKNSAVRVVPFVDGFSAGSSSSSGDFDIRQFDSTGILIYSTDSAGNLHEKPVHYVNPDSTKYQLVALGKSIVAVTNNTYQATYRVTKTLCDTHAELIVDSPFTTDLSDNCGVVWTPNGTVTISDGAVQFNKSYLRSTEPVEFGGQDFTVCFYAYVDSASQIWTAPFAAEASLGYDGRVGQIDLRRYQTSNDFSTEIYDSNRRSLGSVSVNNLIGARHHFEYDYCHDYSTFKIFIDGELRATQACSLERLARYIFLGTNNCRPNEQRMVGYLHDFKIYDGAALHAEDFTPE